MALGHSWSTTTEIYELPDMVYIDTWTFTYVVEEDGVVVVPAGEFQAYGVGTEEPHLLSRGDQQYTMTGERRAPGHRETAEWFSLGVGWVQYDRYGFNELESYQLASVGVENCTWSGVKNLFD